MATLEEALKRCSGCEDKCEFNNRSYCTHPPVESLRIKQGPYPIEEIVNCPQKTGLIDESGVQSGE